MPHCRGPGDHPRSRGEYCAAECGEAALQGSSPLSRGIPCSRSQRPRRTGIIPALAGNTCCSRAGRPERSDHPRSRGEYVAADWALVRRVGSSPLSRGIRLGFGAVGDPVRIIPALAGNTPPSTPVRPEERDHPRSRGEYARRQARRSSYSGSSPLSRGIPDRPPRRLPRPRIIPALAGNTSGSEVGHGRRPDHPRSRGEYPRISALITRAYGSSPLSRGILQERVADDSEHGIIPALAGNTSPVIAASRVCADHPRSRGEYKLVITPHGRREGSSPLSRGILLTKNLRVTKIRIIPALAGNTHFWMSPSPWGWDHPRSRGEYYRNPGATFATSGSSPLSRGIRNVLCSFIAWGGIIPALAGNTSEEVGPGDAPWDHPRSRGEYCGL